MFSLNVDSESFSTDSNGQISVRVSSDTDNGIAYTGNKLIATKGTDGSSGTAGNNYPGASIYGTASVPIEQITVTSAVSLKVNGGPGVNVQNIIALILGH